MTSVPRCPDGPGMLPSYRGWKDFRRAPKASRPGLLANRPTGRARLTFAEEAGTADLEEHRAVGLDRGGEGAGDPEIGPCPEVADRSGLLDPEIGKTDRDRCRGRSAVEQGQCRGAVREGAAPDFRLAVSRASHAGAPGDVLVDLRDLVVPEHGELVVVERGEVARDEQGRGEHGPERELGHLLVG